MRMFVQRYAGSGLGALVASAALIAGCTGGAIPAAPTQAPAAPTQPPAVTKPAASVQPAASAPPAISASPSIAASPAAAASPATAPAAPTLAAQAAGSGTSSPTIALLLPATDAPRYEAQD